MVSHTGASRPLSNQEWRTLLSTRQAPNSATKSGATRELLQSLLSQDAVALGIKISQLHEVADKEYSTQESQTILWRLSELSFRFELLSLDSRAFDRTLFPLISSSARLEAILKCFHYGPSEPRCLTSVEVENANHGLGSPDWRDRIPYLDALRTVMFHWEGFHRHAAARLVVPTPQSTFIDFEYFEKGIARMYCQYFYRHLRRGPVIPSYLDQTWQI
jgi:hypothetical protein